MDTKTVVELRKIAKSQGISYTGLSKSQLVHYLSAPECAAPKKSCAENRICDLFSNRCVENKYLKDGLLIETIDDLQYAGLKKDFLKWYPVLDKIKSEENIPEIIIEPIEQKKEEISVFSDYISRDDLEIKEISNQINLFEKYNSMVYSIINK